MNRVPCRLIEFFQENIDIGAVSVLKKYINYDFVLTLENGPRGVPFRHDMMQVVQFLHCQLKRIPRSIILLNHVPNLQTLKIVNSQLKDIKKADLKGFDQLKCLIVMKCDIETLPGDLFDHTKNMEIVNFKSNKIKYIDMGIISAFSLMRSINLTDNVNINMRFEIGYAQQGNYVSFNELKCEIAARCNRHQEGHHVLSRVGFRASSPKSTDGWESPNATFPEDAIDLGILEGDHYEELKEKIDQEAKLRRSLRNEIGTINIALEELKKNQIQQKSQAIDEQTKLSDAKLNELSETQKKFNEDIDEKFKIMSDQVSAMSNEHTVQHKKINELKEGNKTYMKVNQDVLKKMSDEILRLNKKFNDQQKEIDSLKKAAGSQKKEIKELNQFCADNKKKLIENETTVKEEISELWKKCEAQKGEMSLIVQSHLAVLNEELSKKIEQVPAKRRRTNEDYQVIIGAAEFQIHKPILLAHCPKIADMVRENPKLETFEFKEEEISIESFKEIFNFMYIGIAPSPQSNLISLYSATNYLQMNALGTIIAGMLRDKITPDNAFEVLIFSNEFGKEELKMRAFEEFSKNFPNQILIPEIASQPQVLAKLNAMRMEVENILSQIN